MRSRTIRLGVLAAALLGVLGTMTPAEARTVKVIVFRGAATLNAGLSYPCFPPLTKKCPQGVPNPLGPGGTPLATVVILPLPDGLPPNVSVRVHGGNTRSFAFGSAAGACFTTGFNINKPNKPLTHTPPAGCAISATGTVHGWCGLSQAQGTANATVLGQVITINFHFTGIGGTLIVDGHAFKQNTGQRGLFVGVVVAVPLPQVATPGLTITNSCSTKTAQNFDIVGGGAAALT